MLGLPLVAGLAYEVIRLAGTQRHNVVGRALTAPGSWLQTLTTQVPDDDQIEVAVAALEAAVSIETAPVAAAEVTVAGGHR